MMFARRPPMPVNSSTICWKSACFVRDLAFCVKSIPLRMVPALLADEAKEESMLLDLYLAGLGMKRKGGVKRR